MQYSQLREKIQNPIRTARDVVIHQSLSDRFFTTFTEQVQRNGVYRIPPGSPVKLINLYYGLELKHRFFILGAASGALCWVSASLATGQASEDVC